jgi:hypothetical protein
MGKKPVDPAPEQPEQPAPVVTQQAKPFRYVNLAHVTVPTFFFANGTRADFNADLDKIIETEFNSSAHLRTQIDSPDNQARLVVTGGVTSLEMDVLQLNFKIGWNKSGAIAVPGLNASGEVDLRLSSLSMDFKIYDRYTGRTYLAAYTDETLANLKISARVNLADITSSADILYKTKMADAIRAATDDIVARLEANADFDLLPWEAEVAAIDQEHQIAAFNAGALAGVKAGDVYSIYAACPATPQADCYQRFLSDVRVDKIGNINAESVPLTDKDTLNGVAVGDKVYVKPLQVKPLQ